MPGLTTLHGISAGGDEERRGYAGPLTERLTAWGRAFESTWTPDVCEVYWASLAQECGGKPAKLLGFVSDYAEDVAVYAIKTHRERIIAHVERQIFEAGPGRGLIAHSLGSVIALDLVLGWLAGGRISARRPRSEWPISALVTIGSPLGCEIPGDGEFEASLHRDEAALHMPAPPPGWRWINAADPQDIVVCGTSIGTVPRLDALEGYRRLGVEQLPDVDTGGLFDAHTSYWVDPVVVSAIYELMRRE